MFLNDALALLRLFKGGEFAKLCTRWVGQAGVSTTLLKQVENPLPPLEEQRRIVAEIEGYQNEIACLESSMGRTVGACPYIPSFVGRCPTLVLNGPLVLSRDAVWSGDSESANGAPPSQLVLNGPLVLSRDAVWERRLRKRQRRASIPAWGNAPGQRPKTK